MIDESIIGCFGPDGNCRKKGVGVEGGRRSGFDGRRSLPDDFVHEQRSRGGQVKTVYGSGHGDVNLPVGGRQPCVAEAPRLAADGNRDRAAEIGSCVERFGRRCGGDDGDSPRAQPGDSLFVARRYDGHGEVGSQAGADDVGIMEVGAPTFCRTPTTLRRGHNYRVCPGGVGRAQHRAEVAGLFRFFHDHNEWIATKLQLIQPVWAVGNDQQQAAALAAIGHFREHLRRNKKQFSHARRGNGAQVPGGRLGFGAVDQFRAQVGFHRHDAPTQGQAHLAHALDDRLPGFVPRAPVIELDDALDVWVLGAGDGDHAVVVNRQVDGIVSAISAIG